MTGRPFEAISFRDDTLVMLDQRLLPHEETYNEYRTVGGVADAIRTLVVRGAPAIGAAAAYGMAIAAIVSNGNRTAIDAAARELAATRPTAVDLFRSIERMRRCAAATAAEGPALAARLRDEAAAVHREGLELCHRLGDHGAELVPDGSTVLTHCNAGALATTGHGTALGVIRSAVLSGKRVQVIADETRPVLQGARLTAWELQRDGIEVTVIADVAAPLLLSREEIDLVIVGTDRVAANGDVANKIGTLGVALAARYAGVPFYVAAPWSTIDMDTASGDLVSIEERPAEEVTHVLGRRVVPVGVPVRNPAFDVTPAELVTALITDRGVLRPPFGESIAAADGLD